MKFIRFSALMLTVLTLICQSSCYGGKSNSESETDYYTFTDSQGNTVTLSEKPKRVAVLFASYADVWLTAGGEIFATVSDSAERGFVSANESVIFLDSPSSAGSHTSIDREILLSSDIDFIIGTTDYAEQTELCELARNAGIPSALFKVDTFEEYLYMLDVCTSITGRRDLYKLHGTDVAERISYVKNAVSEHTKELEEQKILFIRAGTSDKSTKAKNSSDTFASAMLAELGTLNIADSAPSLLDGLSLEMILAQDPKSIFIVPMGDESAVREHVDRLFGKEGWRDLSAVKQNAVHILQKDLFHYKPNSRWAEAYEALARMIYPDIEL